MSDPWLYLLAVATILAAPGPTNALLAVAGARTTIARAGLLVGTTLVAYLLAIAAIRITLAPVIAGIPALGVAVKIAVALYLVWLAIKTWRSVGANAQEGPAVSIVDVFVTTLFNPKGLIFALTIIPHEHPLLAWYVVAFAGLVLIAGVGWIALGHLLTRAAGPRASYVPRIASIALVAFAGLILRSVV